MSCHVYDVDKSLHDKAPSYHTTCGCQHDFFGEFVATKKNLGKIVPSFFFLTSKRCHIMKETILVTIYKQVLIVAKSKQESF